jgi:hypothetical protein
MIRVAAMILGTLLSFAANAQTVTIGSYQHPKNESDGIFNKLYLSGARDGLISYSGISTDRLFCLPGELALTVAQAEDIALRWVKKQTKNVDDGPIAGALLFGLIETFPCPK